MLTFENAPVGAYALGLASRFRDLLTSKDPNWIVQSHLWLSAIRANVLREAQKSAGLVAGRIMGA